jgi:hypothetical protein
LQALPGLFSSYGGNEITSNDHVAWVNYWT